MIAFPDNWKLIICEWLSGNSRVDKAYLFGSRSRNDFHENSDIDIGLIISEDMDYSSARVAMFDIPKWREFFKGVLPVTVDLQFLGTDNHTYLPAEVIKDAKLIYERKI